MLAAITLISCKSAPVVKTEPPPPPPKPVKTYKDINIGSDLHITVPSTWDLVQATMPKGFVSFTIKNNHTHMVISGYKSAKSQFSIASSEKELASKTLLYWSGSLTKQKNYHNISDQNKMGGYTQYTCANGDKCFQVFPLSNWRSVIAADLHANDMKFNITAGVHNLQSVHGNDIIKAIKSIKSKSILLQP